MIAEVLFVRSQGEGGSHIEIGAKELRDKSEAIADLFWYRAGSLKKVCISWIAQPRGRSVLENFRCGTSSISRRVSRVGPFKKRTLPLKLK